MSTQFTGTFTRLVGSGCSVRKRYRDWLGCALRDFTLGQGSATGTSYFKLKLHVSSLHATASTAGSLQAESQTQHCKHWRRASLHGRLLALALVQEPGSHKHKLLTRTELAVCRSLQRSRQAVGAVLALTTDQTRANYWVHGYVPAACMTAGKASNMHGTQSGGHALRRDS